MSEIAVLVNKHSQKGYQLGCRCRVCCDAKHDEYLRHRASYIARVKRHKQTQTGKFTDKAWRLKKRYGITGAEYQKLLEEQGSACLICLAYLEGRNLNLDHNHATGNFRGFLCGPCNRGLGHFRDNPDLLEKAARYLKEKK